MGQEGRRGGGLAGERGGGGFGGGLEGPLQRSLQDSLQTLEEDILEGFWRDPPTTLQTPSKTPENVQDFLAGGLEGLLGRWSWSSPIIELNTILGTSAPILVHI